MGLEDRDRYAPGMKLQLERFHQAIADGMPRRGWKVGINVPEVLGHLKLNHSGVGWLDGNNVFTDGAEVTASSGAEFKLEPELAIHLTGSVSADASSTEAFEQIGGVSPAFEIVDYARPKDGFETIVAHSMFHYGCVLGEVQPLEAISEMGTRWPQFEIAGTDCPAPRDDLVPQDLGGLVGFVARFLNEFGEGLEADDIILSGSYTATALGISPGSEVRADFGPLGSLSMSVK